MTVNKKEQLDTQPTQKRLFLIDGHALIFKMYYAFLRRPMINSKGADMSILYGFTKYILELISREKPTHFAVAFDPPGGTFRNEMYPEYKATRSATPQLVIDALEPLSELMRALRIPVLMVKGFEADDVIGTVAKREGNEDTTVYMVTPDKDYGQLVDPHILQVRPGKGGGDDETLDEKAVCEKYGISSTAQVIDVLTLCGDTADNVPGVKGVGEKGAAKLLSKYGDVKSIYAHLDELSEKQRIAFEDARPYIKLSHELVTIKTDVPVPVSMEEMSVRTDYDPVIADLFDKYEFGSLNKYIGDIKPASALVEEVSLKISEASMEEVLSIAKKTGSVSMITETGGEGIFAPVRYITICVQKSDGTFIYRKASLKEAAPILSDGSISKAGADLKFQMDVLHNEGVSLEGTLYDVELMHYLLDPERNHKVDMLAKTYLGIHFSEDKEPNVEEEEAPLSLFDAVEEDKEEKHPEKEAAAILLLSGKLLAELRERNILSLYTDMEEPLTKVLSEMETAGVKIDLQSLRDFAANLRREMNSLEAEIRQIAGMPSLNISSPKQVGDLLFGTLKLDPKAKKGAKGAYTTDEATLLAIADRHPIVDKILEFRAVKKLLSTYIDPFPSYISPKTGKVHTTFNQALTATGRLSSSNPNLQNIPIRTERGKEIRKAFVPSTEEGFILSADYSQIELRIMAHLSCDAHLIDAFNRGVDVHASTAAKIFGKNYEDVTPDERRIAKTANFGIMYGISAFGLSQRLHNSVKESKKIIDDYFAAFPAVRSFIDDVLVSAKENGYVETLFGRRRYIPDINSKNATVRGLAERNAVNAPIQGTSADIIKMAMVTMQRRMKEMNLRSKMVLQIHDELLFDVLPDEVETLGKLVKEVMEGVATLSVPLTVECNYGKNWLEAH